MDRHSVEAFLREFAGWAAAQPDIHAAALVGSHARGAARPTSDVDLVVIADDPARYLRDQTWAAQFGVVQQRQIEDYGRLTSVRIWYADGREVEYGLTDARWAAMPLDEGSRQVIADGMRVLWEREPILSRHQVS